MKKNLSNVMKGALLSASLVSMSLMAVSCASTKGASMEKESKGLAFNLTDKDMAGYTKAALEGLTFKTEVPNGNYSVKVNTSAGEVWSESIAAIAASDSLEKSAIKKNLAENGNKFDVAVCDGVLDLTFPEGATVKTIEITALPAKKPNAKPALFTIGDSTAKNNAYGAFSWGNCLAAGKIKLPESFSSYSNNAMAGRDSAQYYYEGRLERVLLDICPGDYVTVNMGINSRVKGEIEAYYSIMKDYYIEGILQRGGIPVILTATPDGPYKDAAGEWKNWEPDYDFVTNKFKNNRGDGARNAQLRQLAAEKNLKLIEVGQIGEDYMNSLTIEDVKAYNNENGTSFESVLDMVQSWYCDHNHYKEPLGKIIGTYILDELVKIQNASK